MVRFRHLAAVTTGMTFALILLGVYTAAAGAGLSCGANWPLCNGGVFGLFPANWPSFIEWFHRLVAMVTGFMILGTTYAAWRGHKSRRTRLASTVALVVLPVQILLGGATVTTYTALVQVTHHAAALVIFAALVATTVWAYESPDEAPTSSDTTAATTAD
ncbi:COX15/CtaA family protein [Halococcus qingdaonensis]|uniref:COX15/CtaA family protein n=1 Tax=Halococcus qingdaonensis TaxID=224402 RepID=UPI002116F5FF|nr:COX15/CtaA family protein [Halococcus qingdaonensis]